MNLTEEQFVKRFGFSKAESKAMSRREREERAYNTDFHLFYHANEAIEARNESNNAALRAAPGGVSLEILNGINVGAGKRWISKYLTPVDLSRVHGNGDLSHAMMSPMRPLPFASNSLDLIISVHSLEHVTDPIEVILHWLEILRPGGAIGLILPNWRYTWDARRDNSAWGHKWNTDPEILIGMYKKYWQDYALLGEFDSLTYKMGFNMVLQKPGTFSPFKTENHLTGETGKNLYESNKMPGQEFHKA